MIDVDRWDIPAHLHREMTEVARGFRKAPTASEARLWQALRGRRLDGRKFRRQEPIGPFVVDFFCAAERLIVEVDGPIHATQRDADAQRQALLETLGLRFVRVTAAQVETDLPTALELIRGAFRPSPQPSPKMGEGVGADGSPSASDALARMIGEGVGADSPPSDSDSPSPFMGEGAGG